jgi:hypothetical protein
VLKAVVGVTGQWSKELAKNPMLWLMLALPAAMAWIVGRSVGGGGQPFSPIWLVFAQLMTGLMLSSGHWLEERQQGTWQALRTSPVPIGWLLFAQATVVTAATTVSELLVFWLNHGSSPLTPEVASVVVVGAILATLLGIVIGVGSASARSGNMLAMVSMFLLFLAALAGPGLAGMPGLKTLVDWLPSVLLLIAFGPAAGGVWPAASDALGLVAWVLALLLALAYALRRQYAEGR